MDVLLLILLAVACLASLGLAVYQFPGSWLLVAALLGYAWYYHWQRVSLNWVLITVGIALAGELVELLYGMRAAKRAGASRRASLCGLIGGMIGALLLTIPVPVIGTIIGAAIGCFAGAFIGEISIAGRFAHGARSGWHTAIGRTIGTILKLVATCTIAALSMAVATAAMIKHW